MILIYSLCVSQPVCFCYPPSPTYTHLLLSMLSTRRDVFQTYPILTKASLSFDHTYSLFLYKSFCRSASWMPYRDSQLQPLLQRRRLRAGAIGRQSAQLRMENGAAYYSCVTPVNSAGRAGLQSCTEQSVFDRTPPRQTRPSLMLLQSGRRFLAAGEPLSVSFGQFEDGQSPITGLRWELVRLVGMREIVEASWRFGENAATSGIRYVAGDNATLVGGAVYLARVYVANAAGLESESRTKTVYVDGTPPEAGTVALHLELPDGFEDQQGWVSDSTHTLSVTDASLRVLLSGFRDGESGIDHLELDLYRDGRELMKRYTLPAGTDEFLAGGLPPISNGTTLQLEVTAVNRVGMRANNSRSYAISLGLLAIRDVWTAVRGGSRLRTRFVTNPDHVALGFYPAVDPNPTLQLGFRYNWSLGNAPCNDLVSGQRSYGSFAIGADGDSKPLPFGALAPGEVDIFAVDRVTMGGASARIAQIFKATLEEGRPTCNVLTACTISDLSRCVHASTRSITLDTSQPAASVDPPTPLQGTGPVLPLQVTFSCADDESGLASIPGSISISSGRHHTTLLAAVPLVAEDASDTISSSASSVSERSSEAVSPFELTVRVNGSSLSGVLRLFDLGDELPDGTLIYERSPVKMEPDSLPC